LQQYSTMRAGVFRLAMPHPGDVSAVERLILTGAVRARATLAAGKSRGNGGSPIAATAETPVTSRSTSCAS
jgi:hypothetical protein